MIDLRKLHPRHWDFRLIWDVLMVWVALTNLTLILFDLTYLMLRPYYLDFVPVVTRVYDPVKGITPHPLTDALVSETRALGQLLALDPGSPGVQRRVDDVRRLTVRVLRENPFDRSGQERTLEVLKILIAQQKDLADFEKVHGPKIQAVDDQIKKLQDEISKLAKGNARKRGTCY